MSQSLPPNSPPPYSPAMAGPSYAMPQRSTSASAVASLVFGVLGCIPFLPGLLAVLFAIIGLKATRSPQVSGRGLAIAGLVLGLVSICGWVGASGFFGMAYVKCGPPRTVARQFTTDLNAGNVAAASAVAPGIKSAEIQAASDVLKSLGPVKDLTFTSFNYNTNIGRGSVVTIGGVATFANGPKTCSFTLSGNGTTFTITSFLYQ